MYTWYLGQALMTSKHSAPLILIAFGYEYISHGGKPKDGIVEKAKLAKHEAVQ